MYTICVKKGWKIKFIIFELSRLCKFISWKITAIRRPNQIPQAYNK